MLFSEKDDSRVKGGTAMMNFGIMYPLGCGDRRWSNSLTMGVRTGATVLQGSLDLKTRNTAGR